MCTCVHVRDCSRHFANLLVVSLFLSLSPLFLLLPPSPLSPSFCLSLFLRFCAWVEAANSLRIALQRCLCVSERGSEKKGKGGRIQSTPISQTRFQSHICPSLARQDDTDASHRHPRALLNFHYHNFCSDYSHFMRILWPNVQTTPQ